MRSKIIDIPIFNTKIKVYKGDLKELEKKYNLDDTSNYDGFVCLASKGRYDMFVAFEDEKTELDVIVHETVHIVNNLFKITGMQLDLDNDENQAYLTGYIFSKINELLEKWK